MISRFQQQRLTALGTVGLLSALLVMTALLALPQTAQALDYQTQPQLAFRLQKGHANNYFSNYAATTRFTDGFNDVDRYVLEAALGRNIGQHQLAGAYNIHLRQLNRGNEHRLYQQYQYRIPLRGSALSVRGRVEQRYFDHSHDLAFRARAQVAWNKALTEQWGISLGNEVMHNLNTEGNLKRGFSTNVTSLGIRRELASGNQLGLNWNIRYMEQPGAENILRQQIQLFYLYRWR